MVEKKETLVQPYALQLLRKNVEAMLSRKENIKQLDLSVHKKETSLLKRVVQNLRE